MNKFKDNWPIYVIGILFTMMLALGTDMVNASNVLGPTNSTGAIEKSQFIPAENFMWLEKDGKNYFLSDNGRVLLTGNVVITDLWTKQKIQSIQDVDQLLHVNIKDVGFDSSELAMFKVGKGQKRISIFIDPQCPYCQQLLSTVDPYSETYSYDIIMYPVIDEDSTKIARQLHCFAVENPEQALRILQQKLWDQVPTNDCSWEPLQRSSVLAKLLGIKGVPFIIAPDGFMFQGVPKNLDVFLKEHNG